MKTASFLGKYLTIDQLVVFCEIYEAVILRKGRIADAVAALVEQYGDLRDQSSVTKALAALNRKFESAPFYSSLLVKRDDSEEWTASGIGEEFYKFSLVIKREFAELDKRLLVHSRESNQRHVWIRSDLTALYLKQSQLMTTTTHDNWSVELLKDEHFTYAFAPSTDKVADIVFDQLFLMEKKAISYNDYHYFQLEKQSILLVTGSDFRLDDKNTLEKNETNSEEIDSSRIRGLPIIILNNTLSKRIAASVAAITLSAGSGYASASNRELLEVSYDKRLTIRDDSLDSLSLYLARLSWNYALLMSDAMATQLDRIMGVTHKKYKVLHGGKPLYFSECAIVRREFRNNPATDGVLRWMSELDRAQRSKRQVNNESVDYSLPAFNCDHCEYLIRFNLDETDLQGEKINIACPNCLWVNEYDFNSGQARKIKSAKEIRYIADFGQASFECHVCSNDVSPNIKTTTKGRNYISCEVCGTVYQDAEGKASSVRVECPAKQCKTQHSFRVSNVKRVDTISCYNSGMHIEYDDDTEKPSVTTPLNIKEAYLDEIRERNTFPCPHFGCGVIRSRDAIRNVRNEWFSKCESCGNDIRLLVGEPVSATG